MENNELEWKKEGQRESYSCMVDYSTEKKNGWTVLSKGILNKFNPRYVIFEQELQK